MIRLVTSLIFIVVGSDVCGQSFPKDFLFGTATSAYQIEGAWNVSGKSQSNWDYYTHTFPDKTIDKMNGDIACLAYYKIDEDIANLKNLGVSYYRFSIAWTRILPTGFANYVNQPGVAYYNELIDKLLDNNIEPVVTMYHSDMPNNLQDLGGWANVMMSTWFSEYARVLFMLFGDRVKTWITINEPTSICDYGYESGILLPFLHENNIGDYLCGHHIILGHAKAYRIYQKQFKETQQGRVGITLESSWFHPNTTDDNVAARQMLQFYLGRFAHPIFSLNGDYPQIMRERVAYMSKKQGFMVSRLPYFNKYEIELVKGSADFLGLNHYTTFLILRVQEPNYTVPSLTEDTQAILSYDPKWKSSARDSFKVVPWGIRKLLRWIKWNYNNPEIIITENGYAGAADEGLEDYGRVSYINEYLTEISKAINKDRCNVRRYTAWSYMDNYEWGDGYTMKFGLYHVDFNDANRRRTPKLSAFSYQNIIYTKTVNSTFTPDKFLH